MQWKNKRTLSFIFWMALVVVMVAVMPDLNKLVIEKGQITIPETSQNVKGTALLNEMNTEGKESYEIALVFHNEKGLTDEDMEQIESTLGKLEQDMDALKILSSMFHTDSEQAAKQLLSEDDTTVLAQLSIARGNKPVDEVTTKLQTYLEPLTMDTYITGSDVVMTDFTQSTQEGVKKTEIIAIVFIITILIIIFRSPVVPFISLITVGVAYIVSLSIIALLVEHANLPFSNFTQVFLVVILFGIGTDYNILLFTRFKEELAKQGHVMKAIAATYQTAGKTVIYSGLAVLVGFLALFLAQFSMYKATAPVAIGVVVLLLVLITLNPFFMGVFGFKLFWPIKEVKGHADNKFWNKLSSFAFLRPFISIILVAIVTVPFIWNYSDTLNYNDLVEIDDKYESKQAVNLIAEHYDAGFSSPLAFVLSSEDDLATQGKLAELDKLTNIIENVDGVSKVYSVTRPEGERIDDLYVNEQSGQLINGLGDAQQGMTDINSGLTEAQEEVSKPQDLSGVNELITGTTKLKQGASDLQTALNQLSSGIGDGVTGSKQLQTNLQQLTASTGELKAGVATLADNYETLASGFNQFTALFDGTASAISGASQGYAQIEALMTTAAQANSENVEVQKALQIAKQAQKELETMQQQLAASKQQYAQLIAGMQQANAALENATGAITKIEQGASQLTAGAGTLTSGLQQAQNGSNQIATESTGLVTGLQAVNDGQNELKQSLTDLQDQMATLGDGLKQSTDGLDEIYAGLDDANSYLADLNENESGEFFIPQEVLTGEDFGESLNMYMNDVRTMTKMTIILDVNPYTEQAMEITKNIDEKVQSFIASSSFAEDQAYLAGKSMTNVDLQQISKKDFVRSISVMILGITLILLWVTRSPFQTIIIIGALMLTNYAALGMTELINTHLLGNEALSWNVPFFAMIMLITLGVDYSIFYMMRYNETKDQGMTQIIPAATEMGGVIISAAVILGGTFAALIPSGILTLIQVAVMVMVGLLLLTILIMPILLPACFGLLSKVKQLSEKKSS